jgi:uncharacterized membrane protein YphA (DoxX/SURF4 family)
MEAFDLSRVGAACRLVLAAIFLVAGLAKVVDKRAGTTVERAALRDLLPPAHRVTIWRLVGAIEVGGALLAISPVEPAPYLILCMCAVALAYAAWAWRWRPQRPCGCFGSASRAPADARTVARSIFMLVLASEALASHATWWEATAHPLFWLTAASSAMVFLALSPDLRALARRPASRCLHGHAANRRVAQTLPGSEAWRRLSSVIGERTPIATWTDQCVAFLAFNARVADQPAFAVFAVGLRGMSPPIRGTIVDARGNMLEAVDVLSSFATAS